MSHQVYLDRPILNRTQDRLSTHGYYCWLKCWKELSGEVHSSLYGRHFIRFCASHNLTVFDPNLYRTPHIDLAQTLLHKWIDNTQTGQPTESTDTFSESLLSFSENL